MLASNELITVSGKGQTVVVSAEAERIRQGVRHGHDARLVRDVVKIAIRIGREIVDCWGNNLCLDSANRGDGFYDRTGS